MRRIIYFFSVCISLLCSCKDEQDDYKETTLPEGQDSEYCVAIIAPDDLTEGMQQAAQLAMTHFEQAQRTLAVKTKVKIKWIEEERNYNMDFDTAVPARLAKDDSIHILIGGYSSEYTDILAHEALSKHKPLLAPTASSADVQRKYADQDFFWPLHDTDITQCELLLDQIVKSGGRKVAMLASPGNYTKTFTDWFAFLATEMGLEPVGIYPTDDASDVINMDIDYVICVPQNQDEVIVCKAFTEIAPEGVTLPKTLYTDLASDGSGYFLACIDDTEGIATYADPQSGFASLFQKTYGHMPSSCDAQIYDALSLALIALHTYEEEHPHGTTGFSNKEMNRIIGTLVNNKVVEDPRALNLCNSDQFRTALQQAGKQLLFGATGPLAIDGTRHVTTYCHWIAKDGRLNTPEFFSIYDKSIVKPEGNIWEWRPTISQDIRDSDPNIDYGEIGSQWAVLVCSSGGWGNYRHHADVLNMYHLLRENGYSDDHIILIANPEPIVKHPSNLYPGEIRSRTDGKNLYDKVVVDYVNETLTADDVLQILLGNDSKLSTVLKTDENSNVLIYWSGHGARAVFPWCGSEQAGITADKMKKTLQRMYDERRYRQLLLLAEPCYSASMLKATQGIPGVLGIASSNDMETSLASNYDPTLNIWLSDRFSDLLIEMIRNDMHGTMSYRDLYLSLVKNTFGSHVTIHNFENFDNMYEASPADFFIVKN